MLRHIGTHQEKTFRPAYILRRQYLTFPSKHCKYLPIEVQKMISDETGIPMEKIYGVATFYSQFTLSPKGKYRISVCLGTACYVKGSGDIYNAFMEKLGIVGGECTPDGKFSLDACRCVGACGLAPVFLKSISIIFPFSYYPGF